MSPVNRERAAMLREFIHERLGWVIIQGECGQRYCYLGDDQALIYTSKRLTEELKSILLTMQEIEQIRLKEREVA